MIAIAIILGIAAMALSWFQVWTWFKVLDVFIDELTHKDPDSKGK